MAAETELTDIATKESEERERQDAERRAHLAGLDLEELSAEASDDELRFEAMRCHQEQGKPRRIPSVSHKRVLAALEEGLAKLDAYAKSARATVRNDAKTGIVSPHLIASAFMAWDVARRQQNFEKWLREGLEPDGKTITERDLRAEWSATRRALDQRSSAIHNELERRELQRRMERLEARR